MRTTRRRLLSLIGLGAAAAALVPTQTEAAADAEPRNLFDPTGTLGKACHQCQPDSLYPHVYGHINDLVVVGGLTVSDDVTVSTSYGSTLAHEMGAPSLSVSGNATFTDAIAQARADGYNLGREVEMARQEARIDHERELIARFTSMPAVVEPLPQEARTKDVCVPCLLKQSSGIGPFPWTCANGHTVESGGIVVQWSVEA